MPPVVDSDDDAPPPRAASCRACGHDHAPGTTCGICGHHRRLDDLDDDLPRPRLGHDEPIIEVIDKFLCLGAFEHTSKEDVLLACGIRTVMNVRGERTNAAGARRESAGRERRRDGRSGEGLRDVGGSRASGRSAERRKRRRARMAGTRSKARDDGSGTTRDQWTRSAGKKARGLTNGATRANEQSVPRCTPCCSSRQIDVFTAPRDANDGSKLDLGETVRKLEQLHVKAKRADEAGVPNRVLVYCMSGHSRAPSVAVAYLMYSERRKLEDAMRALERRYPRGHKGIKLKPSDLATLEEFERELYPNE